MYERVRVRESNIAELYTYWGDRYGSSVNLFAFLIFGSKSPWLYNIPDEYANSRRSHLLQPATYILHVDKPPF